MLRRVPAIESMAMSMGVTTELTFNICTLVYPMKEYAIVSTTANMMMMTPKTRCLVGLAVRFFLFWGWGLGG